MLVDLSIKESIAILSLNNPNKLNALSSSFVEEIYEKISDIDQKAKVLIITGSKKAFAAGVDIVEINSLSYEDAYIKNFIDNKWECIFNVKIPVIAAVSGYALGGGFELALMSDIIIAEEGAVFGFPEVNLGLMPGMGGTQLLTRIVGPKIAGEIMITGEILSAEKAKELRIVSQVVEKNKLLESSLELARKIVEKPVMSTRIIKEAIRLSQNVGLSIGIQTERQMFRSLFSTSQKNDRIKKFINDKKI